MSNFQLRSDRIGYFPLLVNGLVPDSWDIFTPVSNNPSEFWCAMGSTPEGSSPRSARVATSMERMAGRSSLLTAALFGLLSQLASSG